MVGASDFHLLGVGAEKSSLYRLGLLGFDAYLIFKKRGRFDKGAFKPFCWIVVDSLLISKSLAFSSVKAFFTTNARGPSSVSIVLLFESPVDASPQRCYHPALFERLGRGTDDSALFSMATMLTIAILNPRFPALGTSLRRNPFLKFNKWKHALASFTLRKMADWNETGSWLSRG
ncbi:hypothetical protein VNO78_24408 [Psophocarpus tetragonolobus]|uniref:Uncharacterized protein n=1 Tax=Psophocarpus tetragonolobus TaxID=3891 RepID=A0AAN9XEJ9_PSOTE